jgi:protoporphyrinogen oxidase
MARRGTETLILGAGMTGLAAGVASGFPVLEARERPGGICTSYYVRPKERERLDAPPADGEAYHFELGGGHWIFGGDPVVNQFLGAFATTRRYVRRSGIHFPETGRYVPYPIQNHLSRLDRDVAVRALAEILAATGRPCATQQEWYLDRFGPTLCEHFFNDFNELYTAGLWRQIEPQDSYKSPLDVAQVIRGACGETAAAGYNATFLYPEEGLGHLARALAARGEVRCGKEVTGIDAGARRLKLADGTELAYARLISSLPLPRVMELAGLRVDERPDPFTSVLVLNIGAVKGPRLPEDHWLYVSRTKSGFHRVGAYSNVDPMFLPASARRRGERASLYVERAFPAGARPADAQIGEISCKTVGELQQWGFIGDAEVVDPTWIEVAYTWAWPGSKWRAQALRRLEEHGIHSVGRYGRWAFQGIADSLREGLLIGAAFRA